MGTVRAQIWGTHSSRAQWEHSWGIEGDAHPSSSAHTPHYCWRRPCHTAPRVPSIVNPIPPPPIVPGINPTASNPGSSGTTGPLPTYTPATNGTTSSASVPSTPPPYSAAQPRSHPPHTRHLSMDQFPLRDPSYKNLLDPRYH